jgi:hypothetical protein
MKRQFLELCSERYSAHHVRRDYHDAMRMRYGCEVRVTLPIPVVLRSEPSGPYGHLVLSLLGRAHEALNTEYSEWSKAA